jgi:hypothetical protein
VLVWSIKLVFTPLLIAGASLAGRRWGPSLGGWIVALPLVSGPLVFVLALEQGASFAAVAARGALVGVSGMGGFALAYAWVAAVASWPAALAAGVAGFAAATVALGGAARLPLALLVAAMAGCVVLARRGMPAAGSSGAPAGAGPWDIPLRMITGTLAIVALTRAAPALGPRLSGVLAGFPIVTAVLTVFTHRSQGAGHANAGLRGLLAGVFSYMGFYAVLASTVERAGIAAAFAGAIAAAALVQPLSAAVLRGELGRGRG